MGSKIFEEINEGVEESMEILRIAKKGMRRVRT